MCPYAFLFFTTNIFRMLSFETMLYRLAAAVVLGIIVGFQREYVGKEAGIRTNMIVAAGSAIFAMISLVIPYIAGVSEETIQNTLPDRVLSNIVVGVGFLGAGIIIKEGLRVRGLTTAATVWYVAAIGALCGIGLIRFATVAAIGAAALLFTFRKIDTFKFFGLEKKREEDDEENQNGNSA